MKLDSFSDFFLLYAAHELQVNNFITSNIYSNRNKI